MIRDAGPRPSVGGGDECFLDGVLRRVEVAVAANEGGEDPRRKVAQQVLDRCLEGQRSTPAGLAYSRISSGVDGPSSMIRRTWIGC